MRKGFGKGENGIGDGELKGELANALLLRFSVSQSVSQSEEGETCYSAHSPTKLHIHNQNDVTPILF